jgi:hypothetical protein
VRRGGCVVVGVGCKDDVVARRDRAINDLRSIKNGMCFCLRDLRRAPNKLCADEPAKKFADWKRTFPWYRSNSRASSASAGL